MQQSPFELTTCQIMLTSELKNSPVTMQYLAPSILNMNLAISDLIFNSVNFISLWNCLSTARIALNCRDQIASGLILILIFLLKYSHLFFT